MYINIKVLLIFRLFPLKPTDIPPTSEVGRSRNQHLVSSPSILDLFCECSHGSKISRLYNILNALNAILSTCYIY